MQASTNSVEAAVCSCRTADDLNVVSRGRLVVLNDVSVTCHVHELEALRIRHSVGGGVPRQPFVVLWAVIDIITSSV